jgi:hypothetical protein
MNAIRILALCWVTFIGAFALGLHVSDSKVWPYSVYDEVKQFFSGHVAEDTTVLEKVGNDLGLEPFRHIKNTETNANDIVQLDNLYDPKKHKELTTLNLKSRRANPKYFLSDKAPKGYRVIYGVFDFKEGLHGAIMFNPAGEVVNIWYVSQEDVEVQRRGEEFRSDTNVFPHGFEIANDGSIVTAFSGGSSLTKYDYCGRVVWRTPGHFHHSISFENKDTIWAWSDKSTLSKINYKTGKILKTFSIQDIMDANLEIDIFGILQDDTNKGSEWIKAEGGVWHPNDIDPLSKELAHLYPDFVEGDLLISLRSPNLIFIIDPETLEVKWWRQGLVRRQHDPDWNESGAITIFNNNMHRAHSSIVEIDPTTYKHRTMVAGEDYNFYTFHRGTHQVIMGDAVLITSPDQGRVFETDGEGNIVFDFINTYDDGHRILSLSEGVFLPTSFFKERPECE